MQFPKNRGEGEEMLCESLGDGAIMFYSVSFCPEIELWLTLSKPMAAFWETQAFLSNTCTAAAVEICFIFSVTNYAKYTK